MRAQLVRAGEPEQGPSSPRRATGKSSDSCTAPHALLDRLFAVEVLVLTAGVEAGQDRGDAREPNPELIRRVRKMARADVGRSGLQLLPEESAGTAHGGGVRAHFTPVLPMWVSAWDSSAAAAFASLSAAAILASVCCSPCSRLLSCCSCPCSRPCSCCSWPCSICC